MASKTLINTVTPELQIYNPASGTFAKFSAGRLVIDEDDPNYGVVMAEAARNPAISVHAKGLICEQCGQQFTGKMSAAKLGAHKKELHFDTWLAEKDAEAAAERDIQLKARSGYVCEFCSPVQEFGTVADLAEHVKLLHTQPPAMDAEGNSVGGDEGGSGGGAQVSTEIPAATPSGS